MAACFDRWYRARCTAALVTLMLLQEAVGAFSGYTLEDAKGGGAHKKDAKPKPAPAEKPKKEEEPKPAREESKPAPAVPLPPKSAPAKGLPYYQKVIMQAECSLCPNGACASQVGAQCASNCYAALVIGLI